MERKGMWRQRQSWLWINKIPPKDRERRRCHGTIITHYIHPSIMQHASPSTIIMDHGSCITHHHLPSCITQHHPPSCIMNYPASSTFMHHASCITHLHPPSYIMHHALCITHHHPPSWLMHHHPSPITIPPSFSYPSCISILHISPCIHIITPHDLPTPTYTHSHHALWSIMF